MARALRPASRARRAGCLVLLGVLGAVAAGPSTALAAHRAHHKGHARGAQSATPVPDATGPIPITSTSRPFTVEGVDLGASGYTLDEYFVSGQANVYDWGADGKASTPRVRTPGAPYTTRMVVRRPVKPHAFSGNVWVELNNPSRGYDVELQWPSVHQKFLRDGDIVVSFTAKPISVAALKRFDAKRYAPLSMANPLPPSQQTCGSLPGDPGYDENTSKLYENGLVWDMTSQIGALLHSRGKGNPLNGYHVKDVFLTGESQTGFFVNTYAANFASAAHLGDGGPAYDGIVSVSGAGRTTPINQCVPATAPDDPRSALPKGHVPFMRIDSQSEPFTLGGYATRRADSDAPDDPYRMYEIAGAAHGWADIYNYQPPFADIAAAGGVPVSFSGCVEDKWNSLPRQFFEPAMFKNMERWVIDGQRPPREAEPLRVVNGGTPQAAFQFDQFGNALGGVRTPYVDVPLATYYDWATAKAPGGFCTLFGHEVRFTSAVLEGLYHSHQDYVAKVTASVDQLLRGRWVEPAEAQDIINQAKYQTVP
jgi:alpha/beta hydrolase family protein